MGVIVASCKVCGAAHRACGPATTVTPIDANLTTALRGGDMALKSYEVVVPGRRPHTTTLLLSDEDAKRHGVFGQHENTTAKKEAKKAAKKPAANKARTPADKATKPAADKVEKPADEKEPETPATSDTGATE